MSNLLVLGNDKIAGLAYKKVSDLDGLDVLIDKSTNVKRIIKLLRKKRIQIGLVLKMLWAEVSRNGSKPRAIYHPSIQTRICAKNCRKRPTIRFIYLEPVLLLMNRY